MKYGKLQCVCVCVCVWCVFVSFVYQHWSLYGKLLLYVCHAKLNKAYVKLVRVRVCSPNGIFGPVHVCLLVAVGHCCCWLVAVAVSVIPCRHR